MISDFNTSVLQFSTIFLFGLTISGHWSHLLSTFESHGKRTFCFSDILKEFYICNSKVMGQIKQD